MRPHTTHTRDSAVRRLSLSTRWMIAGSVALTGALSEVAAQAFPGKTLKATGPHASSAAKAGGARYSHSQSSSSPLAAPSRVPQSTPERTTERQATPERTKATPEAHSEATPEAHSEAAPEARSEATHETSTPAQAAPEAPVVSGGS
jgi:hypothetical protein